MSEIMTGSKTIYAKFMGTCRACTEPIEAGALCEFYGKGEIYHFDCRPSGEHGKKQAEGLKQKGYLFIDLETGGITAKTDGIVQIGAIATSQNFLLQSKFQTLVNPPANLILSERAREVHGYTREMLADAPIEYEALSNLIDWCNQFPEYRFAGYNCAFDLDFLNQGFERNGMSKDHYLLPAFDLLGEAIRKLRGKTANHKLVTVCDYFKIEKKKAHDAVADIFMTVQVARELKKIA